MSADSISRAHQLLDASYEELDLQSGALLQTSELPGRGLKADEWRNRGEWLLLGHRMGAEKIFFVDDDPVILFSAVPSPATETDIVATYRRAWSMGRAKCLFLATDTELRVYALNDPPPRALTDSQHFRPIDQVRRAADVADRLLDYHREKLEAGLLFEHEPYRDRSGRADEQLLQDVEAATEALVEHGLSRTIAHALIERVILVRYLEDRRAIGPEYFTDVADRASSWTAAMQISPEAPSLGAQSTFVRCLANRDLTYAVFDKLADTFNGDMFLISDTESDAVTVDHLVLIQQLLTGGGISEQQQPLFLWAYDFSVVPTSLIGSMYEQFYRADTEDDSSTHYTPQELAEYVVAQTLTPEVLAKAPRVCDPACGSGVFLVEAFRRIVRHEMTRKSERLSPADLRNLLLTRIAGVDINSEAIRLAAFSLYLAYLNYQNPPDITAGGHLPHLIYRGSENHTDAVLVIADAFSPFQSETVAGELEREPSAAPTPDRTDMLPWPAASFDVVIGNPPWDEPRAVPWIWAEIWAKQNNFPVGDRSPSQLFLWRALSYLQAGGTAALLVAATAFHNIRSRNFRRQWLRNVSIVSITDFTSARYLFFSAAAPFALAIFRPHPNREATARFAYQSVRPSDPLKSTRSMSYARSDRRWVDQEALYTRDYLWKTYAWGGHRDAALMARLDIELQLRQVVPSNPSPGWGYQRGDKNKKVAPSEYLASIPSLRRLELSGPLRTDHFEPPPAFVKRCPDERRYSGQRILLSEGVRPGFGPVARLVYDEFSFRHIIYCIPLPVMPSWQAKLILGTLISSLGRYRMFMRSSSWGLWRDKVNAEDILSVPVRLPESPGANELRIAELVDSLTLDTAGDELLGGIFAAKPLRNNNYSVRQLLRYIDEEIYDLFELSQSERDLVDDFHRYVVDIPENWQNSRGLQLVDVPAFRAGTSEDIERVGVASIRDYLDRFVGEWNKVLQPSGEFSWEIVGAPRNEMLGAIFETRQRGAEESIPTPGNWAAVLDRLERSLSMPVTSSVSGDLNIRSVSDTSIVIVKRREARLWNATTGREDAEATMLQAMRLQEA
jgi:hypothetical protein